MGLIKIALGFLPGWGWLASLGASLVEMVGKVFGAAFRGLTVIFANPVTLVTVGMIAMAAFATGLVIGSKEGRQRVATMTKERDNAVLEAKGHFAQAMEARKAAEEAEARAQSQVAQFATVVAPTPPPKPRRVQQPTAKPSGPGRLCVPGLSAVGFGCD